jgi:excisionase family DNA binding protein
MSTHSAARLCNISQDTISRWAANGTIEARRMGPKVYQINVDSLRKFLEPYNHLK